MTHPNPQAASIGACNKVAVCDHKRQRRPIRHVVRDGVRYFVACEDCNELLPNDRGGAKDVGEIPPECFINPAAKTFEELAIEYRKAIFWK